MNSALPKQIMNSLIVMKVKQSVYIKREDDVVNKNIKLNDVKKMTIKAKKS